MILVTGARGFLGQYCLRELSKYKLPLFLTTSDKNACGKRNGYTFYYLNLEDRGSLSVLPRTVDTVIHFAAVVPKKSEIISFTRFMEINAFCVKSLIEKAAERGCRRFIYISTQMVIGKSFYLPVDEKHLPVPSSDYGLSKFVGERYCLSCADFLNMDVISLRFAEIYGARQNSGFVLAHFIERAMNNLHLVVHGDGKICRDLLYVKDAVQAILCALNSNATGIFNIGSGVGVSIRELAETISEVFSHNRSIVEFDYGIKEAGEDFYMDINKARKELNFNPKYSLREGLKDYKSELAK